MYKDLVSAGIINKDKTKPYKDIVCDKYIYIEDAILWSSIINTVKSKQFMVFLVNIRNSNNNNFSEYFKHESNRIRNIMKRKENRFLDSLSIIINEFNLSIIRQYKVLSYRIDGYIPELNIAIEYDENGHKSYSYENHELRQLEIEKELGCKFIRVTDEYSINKAIGIVLKNIMDVIHGG
ncbi:MAG: hypothetical protein ACRC18_06910 [Cetobacterium sp.]